MKYISKYASLIAATIAIVSIIASNVHSWTWFSQPETPDYLK